MSNLRCKIELGSNRNPRAPAFRIARIRSEVVRTSIVSYLTVRGVELDRDEPPGWFSWLDERRTAFQARCADPPVAGEPDDGYQPFNYFILARILSSLGGMRWEGIDFYHESALLSPPEPDDDCPV